MNEQFSIVFQIDTGAACNILRMEDLPPPLIIDRSEKLNLRFFNNSQTTTLGTCTLNLPHGSEPRMYLIKFHVVDNSAASLLGMQASMEMGLIEVKTGSICQLQAVEVKLRRVAAKDFPKIYPQVFKSEVGCFPGTCKFDTLTAAKSTHMATRHIPIALKDSVQTSLFGAAKDYCQNI